MSVTYLHETPSQTAGPYVHIGTVPSFAGLNVRTDEKLDVLTTTGNLIRIEGIVYDGTGTPVPDGIVEIWQADENGNYNANGFNGWGRAPTGGPGAVWSFQTVKPGATKWRDGRTQAPHINVLVFARGINIHLHTRLYFPEDEALIAADPVLGVIHQPKCRETLIATRVPGGGIPTYRFDIHLQGEHETVFFDA
ncbi:MAG: protocatechuate 3,4-dioxygenase subunit alpha [Acidocella sp.]|nr:protocatechuate 3,4-dioxygenase subunit alpha [Acidocella sp.]